MSECKLKIYGKMHGTMGTEERPISALLCNIGKGRGFDACVECKCKHNVQVNNTKEKEDKQ